MKNFSILFLLFVSSIVLGQNLDTQLESKRVMLPNGWSLTPAGRSVEVGDLPLNIAVSSTKNGLLLQTMAKEPKVFS